MIQLKIRTEYSFGKTFAKINDVIKTLKEQNCTHAAIVDDNTWGHVSWFRKCKEAGIEPILGIEICVSDDSVLTPKMCLLAANKNGLRELYRAVSKSHTQAITGRSGRVNRLYRADVEAMSDDIFKLAGDIIDGEWLASINVILDLSPASFVLNKKKMLIQQQYGLRLIETSDNAYCKTEDKNIFELISKVGLKMTTQHILPELKYQEAAIEIAKQCENLELSKAPTIRAEGDLEQLCRDGIKFRGMQETWSEEYETRLKYELELIQMKDFSSYFIIVADLVIYAKQFMLVGPSRGSSAGSLVCYLTRITEIDPIPPGLYFERFIDVSRMDLPDIDIDFPDEKRHIVFEYMAEKYGFRNTAHIGTISRFKSKSSLIAVCKALDIPPSATAGVKTAMLDYSSGDARANNCLEDTFILTEPGRHFIANYPSAIACQYIEGHADHTGVHAAGLLICNDEIMNYCVVDADGIAHLDKHEIDFLNLLKIDALGLRTLSILEDAAPDVDFYNLTIEDKKTYEIFNDQKLCSVFQFDGRAMQSVSGNIAANRRFTDITYIEAATALARPGPFSGGVTEKWLKRIEGEKYKPIHPLVEKIMSMTFGLPIYQEQTLAIVRFIGKMSWEEITIIRKAMSKSMGKDFFNVYWEKFKAGAIEQGITESQAQETWDLISKMGSWQMNKAHVVSYARISYWCAWVKAHRPLEFAAANLRRAKDEDSAIMLLREMHKEGIYYVPFDIKLSELNWSAKDGKLIGGFVNLKGIGASKGAKLIEARSAGKLTAKQIETINKAENVFEDIFPFKKLYKHLYDDPNGNGIMTNKIWKIEDIPEGLPQGFELVFIGEMTYKNPRNANEDVNVKKRDGKLLDGPLEFMDLRLRDDTGTIGCRIGRHDYPKIGIQITEKVPIGSHLLIRAVFWNGIRYAFIKKWKLLK